MSVLDLEPDVDEEPTVDELDLEALGLTVRDLLFPARRPWDEQ